MPRFAEDAWLLILLTTSRIRLLVGNSTLQSKVPISRPDLIVAMTFGVRMWFDSITS